MNRSAIDVYLLLLLCTTERHGMGLPRLLVNDVNFVPLNRFTLQNKDLYSSVVSLNISLWRIFLYFFGPVCLVYRSVNEEAKFRKLL